MKNKSKSSSKSVKAPLTYDPGKGRPKEYLAYLNYQEMQALKRLNGEGPYKGPKGIPSFVLGGATTKGTAANRAMSSAAQSNKAPSTTRAPAASAAAAKASASKASTASRGSSSVSRISGGTAGSNAARAALSGAGSTSRGGSASVSRISGGTAGSNAARAALSGVGGTSRGGSASVSRISGGTPGGNQRDAQFKAAAESRSISKAVQTPALKQDAGRSAIGGISKDKSAGLVDASKIRGAIQGVKDLGIAGVPGVSRVGVPKATITTQQMKDLYSQYQQPPSPPPTKRQIAERLREVYPDRWGKYSISEVENAVDKLAQSLPGEADINKYSAASMRNLAQVGINQVVRNITPEEMLKAIDTTGLDIERGTQGFAVPGSSSMGMTGNWADQNLARQSYETALRSIESAIENKGVSPQARYATNFVAAGTPMVRDVRSVGQPVYGTQFGIDPVAKSVVEQRNRMADVKRDYAQYRSPPAGVTIVPAAATPERSAVPGLIQYPRLDRPMAPTAGRSAVIPTSRKPITDRIAPEYPRISSDPTMAGKDLTPRGKQIYDRIISESGDLPISIGGDVRQAFGAGAFGTGQISVPPSGIDASGSIAGSAGYSQDVIRDVYAGSVVPSRFRSATQVAAELPSPIRPVGTIGGVAGLGAVSEPGSVPVSTVDALVGGVPGVNAKASGEAQFPNVGLSGEIAGVPGIPPDVTSATATVSAAERGKIPGLMRVSNIFAAGSPADLARNLRGQITEGYETFRPENVAESVPPSQESAPPSQDVTLSPEAEQAQEETRKKAKTTRRGAQIILNAVLGPGVGTGVGLAFGALDRQVQKLVDAYQSAGMTERKAMEEKYPNLIPRAQAMGINSYYGMDKYYAWAESSGLRGPPSREGGGPGGIASLGGGFRDDDQTGVSPTPDTPSTPSGRRPDIYYMWDLGVNIPSPGDPNYTQYQTYLAERLAAQRAMGYV